jgi:hypothetical protein
MTDTSTPAAPNSAAVKPDDATAPSKKGSKAKPESVAVEATEAPEPEVHGPLRIVCSQPGFRRAGIAHPASATHPADTFSAAQLAQLRAEPKLTVVEL